MIPRYTLPEMGRIWSEENKFSIWLRIEILACEAQAELGVTPHAAVASSNRTPDVISAYFKNYEAV
jgi:adenylosuccinate lyase